MGGRLSGLGSALYDSKKKELLGRDGGRWGKLGVFYFFFYLGLAGFFCTMLAIFMAFTPRDRPRYILDSSRMATRSNPLSPGLGFRPQPEVDKNLIIVNRNAPSGERNAYVDNLDKYLQIYYWKQDKVETRQYTEDNLPADSERQTEKKFNIKNPGECTSNNKYGFPQGRPCVLVKMNKIVGFTPTVGSTSQEKHAYENACGKRKPSGTAIHCYGEYPADADNIGNITYISENGQDDRCGSLESSWFPYNGKYDRKDYYQAPYVWVQFKKPVPNVLINVLCRVYGHNIDFDKKTGRALTRFQIYVEDTPKHRSSRQIGEF